MKRKFLILGLLAGVLLAGGSAMLTAGGCSQQQAENPKDPNESYVAAAGAFTATVKIMTVAQEKGAFDGDTSEMISIVIHQGQDCLDQWYYDLTGRETVVSGVNSPEDCVVASMIKLLEYKKKGGVR